MAKKRRRRRRRKCKVIPFIRHIISKSTWKMILR
jgi:hypothetical protein